MKQAKKRSKSASDIHITKVLSLGHYKIDYSIILDDDDMCAFNLTDISKLKTYDDIKFIVENVSLWNKIRITTDNNFVNLLVYMNKINTDSNKIYLEFISYEQPIYYNDEVKEMFQSVNEIHYFFANETALTPKEKKTFTFDHTYDWRATQELIFNQTALPILESIMEGYNGTIFAYGQTGTGKTYTMEGNDNETDKGIIPRSIDWIFNNIKNYPAQQFLVRVSFVEIYNEEVRDLLSKVKRQKLNVREKDKVFYVENVTIIQSENSKMTLDIMKAGRVNRATGATKMNPGSSRSHSIFSITVESSTTDEAGEAHYKVGKLNLVD